MLFAYRSIAQCGRVFVDGTRAVWCLGNFFHGPQQSPKTSDNAETRSRVYIKETACGGSGRGGRVSRNEQHRPAVLIIN